MLLDDRNERPGVKFADADNLIHRIVIGETQNGVVNTRSTYWENKELSPESALARVTDA